MSVAYIQVHFRLDFIKEANNTSPEQSDLGPNCLQYRLHMIRTFKQTRGADDKSYEWLVKG